MCMRYFDLMGSRHLIHRQEQAGLKAGKKALNGFEGCGVACAEYSIFLSIKIYGIRDPILFLKSF